MSPRPMRSIHAAPTLLLLALVTATATATSLRAGEVRLRDALAAEGTGWTLSDGGWTREGEALVAAPGTADAIAIHTIPDGAAGFYAVEESFMRRDGETPGTIALQVQVHRRNAAERRAHESVVVAHVEAGELFDFDSFLGYLVPGDSVHISVGADGDVAGDRTAIDCVVARLPSIPVAEFPADGDQWVRLANVDGSSAVARQLAWNHTPAKQDHITFAPDASETLLAFRVPQSGFYAISDASAHASGSPVRVRLYVGDQTTPLREIIAVPGAGRASLDTEIGYVARGQAVWVAFSGDARATAGFEGSVIEWAPRRAPLRVRRGVDSLLDVFEPSAPRRPVDVPASHWLTVAAPEGGRDATAAIREALARAGRTPRDTGVDYAGIRLERGKTYTIASNQEGGAIFALDMVQRVIFDGNGATLRIASPEFARRDIELFTVRGSRNLVFHDMIVTAGTVPFTTGEILDVSPRGENTQTVTFEVDPGALDPLADISRDGRNNAYAYDPVIPGRLALGTWTHYPGSGNPSIQATDTPGVFTHRVTRTGNSIEPGGKWLIKNKRAGVVYLTTRGSSENVTLSGIDGRASGGGTLRFWQTSGINILDSAFEPEGDYWISSSADGVHGRGREGVWIENTLIRGVCEDIMNIYGQNMIVVDDGDPADAVMSIRMFNRSSESFDDGAMPLPTEENVVAGDQLMFFNPNTGRVLGYAHVRGIANGRFTLSNAVTGIEPWREGAGKTATMVYNTRVAGRFFVRDSRFMDSMRFGIYIKARGGVVFNTQFEGLSGPSIFATNEPEWPEGPPATHLWVQGCTFSQNNFGYMPRHRDFMVVDPADISVYTRRFRDPAEPDDHRAHLTHGQFANSHMKFIGNVFHDWRGMGISVRNARNVHIANNLFLPPVNDDVMRATLAQDPTLMNDGHGAYAAIHVDSADGVQVGGNRFIGLPAGDRDIARGGDVTGVVVSDSESRDASDLTPATVSLSFDAWFGPASREPAGIGTATDEISLGSATHRAGRLGGGLSFSGGAPAVLAASEDAGNPDLSRFTLALWARPADAGKGDQVVAARGDEGAGLIVALVRGRWIAGVWSDERESWLDLGVAVEGQWQHLAVTWDGAEKRLLGYVDGREMAQTSRDIPTQLDMGSSPMALGGVVGSTRLGEGRLGADHGGFDGELDEFRFFPATVSRATLSTLALRWIGEAP